MSVLAKLGLHRREMRAWASYDWAISGVQTVIQTAVFPIYFVSVAAAGYDDTVAIQLHARANTVAMVIVALLAPILGAIADYSSAKKRFLAFFTIVGALACIAMYGIDRGEMLLAASLFVVSMAAAAACMVFYDGLLPTVATGDDMHRLSTSAYGIGYLGGGILVALNLLWIQKPEWFGLGSRMMASQVTFVSVGVWWLLFAIPLFRGVPEPRRQLEIDETPETKPVRAALSRLRETLVEFRGYRQAFLMLAAFLIYNDGTQTIIKMATSYGKREMGLGDGVLIGAIVLVQFVGVPFAILFGRLGSRIGAKPAIFIGLAVYTVISILAYFMTTATHFIILAVAVGMVQGGTQALSRSLFASMIPTHKSGEFFGFYSVFEKFAGIFGPLFFDIAITATGSSRSAILSVIVFFIVGAVLLSRVNVAEGQATARRREIELTQSLT